MITKLKQKCEKIYRALLKESDSPSAESFVTFYNNHDSYNTTLNMSSAIGFKIAQLEKDNKWGTAKTYRSTLVKWLKFIEEEHRNLDIPVQLLSRTHLEQFVSFVSKGRGSGGVGLRIVNLKAAFLAMITSEAIPADTPSPFEKFVPKEDIIESTTQKPLTQEQWLALKAYTPKNTARAFWRDVFLMMVYGQGINFKDLVTLKPSNIISARDPQGNKIEAIRFVRSKTKEKRNGDTIEIYYSKDLKALINKYHTPSYEYLVPILEYNCTGKMPDVDTKVWYTLYIKCRAAFNYNLRKIAKELDLPHFSNYAARHTFASLLFWEGVEVRIISQALGHKTQAMTYEYLSKLDLVTMRDNIKDIL